MCNILDETTWMGPAETELPKLVREWTVERHHYPSAKSALGATASHELAVEGTVSWTEPTDNGTDKSSSEESVSESKWKDILLGRRSDDFRDIS